MSTAANEDISNLIDSDPCVKTNSRLLGKIKDLEDKLEEIEAEKDELLKMKQEGDTKLLAFEKDSQKYYDLTSFLRSSLECPVCLEVPISGPISQCRNGHLICVKCKRNECPICRVRMDDNVSRLAVNLMENIEHSCKLKGCGKLFSLDNLETHMKVCPYRKIKCPSPTKFCGLEVPFRNLLDHILTDCNGSYNKKRLGGEVALQKEMPIVENYCENYPVGNVNAYGYAYQWRERFFYTAAESDDGASVFNILYLGDKSECNEITVEISATEDPGTDASEKPKKCVKVVCEPLPVDATENERKKNGLVIGNLQLIATKDDDEYAFSIVYNIIT